MIPLSIFHVIHPLVNPRRQRLVAAQNFENGEVVGKAYYLVTHKYFCQRLLGITPVPSDYSFSMVNGGDAFAIDSSTGIITVSNISNFTADTIITVRCTFLGEYFEDQEISIERILIANAVYLDPAFVGTSTGTRAQPYVRARSYPSGSRYGKTFFYKSGTTTTDEYLVMQNNSTDPWTRFARWGTGARPVIDITGQNAANRFMNVGTTGDNPAFKIRVCEITFINDVDDPSATAVYPFQVRPVSRNFEIYNCDFTGSIFRQGFIWCPLSNQSLPIPYDVDNPDRIFSNLEFYDYRYQDGFGSEGGNRAIKLECGGNFIENCIASTTFTGSVSAGISHVDMPGSYAKYCLIDSSAAINNRGFNIRVGKQTYENCVSIGPNEGFVIFNNNQSGYQSVDPLVGPSYPVDGTSYVKNCIAIGCSTAGLAFVNSENTAVAAPATAVGVSGLITYQCGNGINIDGGTRNVKIKNAILLESTSNGVRHFSGAGNGLEHCLVFGSGGSDINVTGAMTGQNTVYGTKTGTFTETTCDIYDPLDFEDVSVGDFRPVAGSPLIGAGTFISASVDISGENFLDPPSIGVFEFIPPPEPTYILTLSVSPSGFGTASQDPAGPHESGSMVDLLAVPASGKQFVGWYDAEVLLSDSETYVYTTTAANKTITALFEDAPTAIYTITLVVDLIGGGSVSQSPGGLHSIDDVVQLSATVNPGYVFSGWFVGESLLSELLVYNYTVAGNVTITASYALAPTYTVTVTSQEGGSAEETTEGPYLEGEEATVQATADSGFSFSGWYVSDVFQSSANPYTFEVGGNVSIVAHFSEIPLYNINLSVSPEGSGTAVKSPPEAQEVNEPYTITATPGVDRVFVRWSVDGDTFSVNNPFNGFMNAFNLDVVAEFTELLNRYSVTLESTPGGTAAQITQGPYLEGEGVILSAIPDEGFSFSEWRINGFGISFDPGYTFDMPAYNLTFQAVFVKDIKCYNISVMIEDVHKIIRDSIRKSTGSYVSPAQIDRGLNRALNDYVSGLLQAGNNSNVQPLERYIDEVDFDYVNSFRYCLPENFLKEINIYSKADGTEYEGDILKEQEFADRANSRIVGPDVSHPIARIVGGKIEIRPAGNFTLSYYRKPITCRYNYTVVNDRDIVFNPIGSVDLDCNESAMSDIVSRTLSYLGVPLEAQNLFLEEQIKK